MPTYRHLIHSLFTLLLVLSLATTAHAQLDEHCTVAVLNRTVQVKPDGTWVLPNIPANFGQVRARATCVENGMTRSGESALFSIPANGSANVPRIQLDAVTPIPSSLSLSAPRTTLTTAGETVQVTVTARFPDGSTQDVSAGSTGTNYVISNPAVATISPDGLVTAVASGTVIISALHEGALGLLRLQVILAGGDSDGDGLTNKQELIDYGTNLNLTDTDGDGLSDGAEVRQFGTNPLLVDTDGDGTNDGREVQCGSDPKNATDRGRKLISITVAPPVFTINANTILLSEAYWQLAVTGTLANNCGTVNLTPIAQGTNYTSSNLTTCNFGTEGGRVFAGADGTCPITASNSGLSAMANGTVTTFAPTTLASLNIPGTTNNVEVSGDFAYVAAGAAGLQIVNVADRSAPVIAGSLDTPGNAQDVQVIGNLAYVADGASGLRIIDVTNPNAPVSRGVLDTPGDAQDVVVNGSRAFVADGASGLRIIDVTNPAAPSVLGFVDTAGTASGVDVDPQRNLAVVADGATGIQVIDITDVAHPTIIGSVDTGTAADVVVRDAFAFVADLASSLTVVDLSDPRIPVVRASTPASTGGLLNDLALTGRFVLGAATFRPTNVPIIDVSTPPAPQPRALLNFSAFSSDVGTGIAADSAFVYLTTGGNRLLIGQYLAQEDDGGHPPTVRIASPAPGETVIEGSSLPITAEASDDIAVVAVSLLVNGNVIATDTSAPYQFNFTVPEGISSLTFGATAGDLGGNEGTAEDVTVNVIPDPLTTAIGSVVDKDGNPVEGATVTCLGVSSLSDSAGAFSITGLPTIRGAISCEASFMVSRTTLKGRSQSVPPVLGGTTDVGVITVTQILTEDFEDGILDSMISIQTVNVPLFPGSSQGAGIKNVTALGSTKAFGFGRSSCGASCFDNYVSTLKITLGEPTFVSTISFKYMELFENWGSGGRIVIDGVTLAGGTFGRLPYNDRQPDSVPTLGMWTVNKVVTVIDLRVGDITNRSEIYIDDLIIK